MAASSRQHGMFKSKLHLHQWQQHEHHRTLSSSGCEERSNEPRPRWNPKPEQIRVLEAIFNSGMVNPPRDEIRRIRVQLQKYGKVCDHNVFYWFQNRKTRSKHKEQRNIKSHSHTPTTTLTSALTSMSPPTLSKSGEYSQKLFTNDMAPFTLNITDGSLNSPTPSVNQPFSNFYPISGEFVQQPFFFPVLSGGDHAGAFAQGFNEQIPLSDEQTARKYSNLLLTELMINDYKKVEDEKYKSSQQQQLIRHSTTTTTMSTNYNHVPGSSTVIINDVKFEVPSGLLNVKEVFGVDVVLIHSSGQPMVTNEWGVTLQPLQRGAFYFLI